MATGLYIRACILMPGRGLNAPEGLEPTRLPPDELSWSSDDDMHIGERRLLLGNACGNTVDDYGDETMMTGGGSRDLRDVARIV